MRQVELSNTEHLPFQPVGEAGGNFLERNTTFLPLIKLKGLSSAAQLFLHVNL